MLEKINQLGYRLDKWVNSNAMRITYALILTSILVIAWAIAYTVAGYK